MGHFFKFCLLIIELTTNYGSLLVCKINLLQSCITQIGCYKHLLALTSSCDFTNFGKVNFVRVHFLCSLKLRHYFADNSVKIHFRRASRVILCKLLFWLSVQEGWSDKIPSCQNTNLKSSTSFAISILCVRWNIYFTTQWRK